MTLKQKFFDVYTKYYKKSNELDEMVQIADEYAIEFAEWKEDNSLRVDLDDYKVFGDSENDKPHTLKEILEIFKKEKGYGK